MRIKINKSPQLLDEALQNIGLPAIINTKIMEDVTINAKAQETFGKFIRDFALTKRGIWVSDELKKIITLQDMPNTHYDIMRALFENKMKEANVSPKKTTWLTITKVVVIALVKDANLDDAASKKALGEHLERWANRMEEAVPGGYKLIKQASEEFTNFYNNLLSLGYGLKEKLDKRDRTGAGRSDIENNRSLWIEIRRALKKFQKMFRRKRLTKAYENRGFDGLVDKLYLTIYKHALNHQGGQKIERIINFINGGATRWRQVNAIMLGDDNNARFMLNKISKLIADFDAEKAFDRSCSPDGGDPFDSKEPCLIHKYEDGYFWFNRAARSCAAFGEEGRNCGGGNFLLIDLQKKGDSKRSWHIGLDFDFVGGVLRQVLGIANSFPDKKYWSYVKDFVERYDVQHIDDEAFQYTNPRPDEAEVQDFLSYVLGDKYSRTNPLEQIEDDIRDGVYDIEHLQFYRLGEFKWNLTSRNQPNLEIMLDPEWTLTWKHAILESIIPNSEESFKKNKIVSDMIGNIKSEIVEWWDKKMETIIEHPQQDFFVQQFVSEIRISKDQPYEFDEPPRINTEVDIKYNFSFGQSGEITSKQQWETIYLIFRRFFGNLTNQSPGVYNQFEEFYSKLVYEALKNRVIDGKKIPKEQWGQGEPVRGNPWETEQTTPGTGPFTNLFESWKKNANIKPKKKINKKQHILNEWYKKRRRRK